MNARIVTHWSPEDPAFWHVTGKPVAHRNLWISSASLLVAFGVWTLWSVVVVVLPAAGFPFSAMELFWLVALPGLTGAALRMVYALLALRVDGRRFLVCSTLALLVPVLGLGIAVQYPQTPYPAMLLLAALCGLGGGSFASSMTGVTALFPQREVGSALTLNAGLGNLGVSLVQFLTPIVITLSVFGLFSGPPQYMEAEGFAYPVWLQNAALVWVPLILVCALLARYGMYETPPPAMSRPAEAVLARLRYWVLACLYLGTFGSFIGFSVAFPLFAHVQFPSVDVLQFVFIGPLMGALARPVGGWLAERFGGGVVTFWCFGVMAVAAITCLGFLPGEGSDGSFWGVMLAFTVLFIAAGFGNGAMFRMVPELVRQERADSGLYLHEAARLIGLVSSVGALGGFAIPVLCALALAVYGGLDGALFMFGLFYLVCMAVTWWFHVRVRNADR